MGCVLALSSLYVFYRDVQHLLANFLTFIFFLCPVVYPRSNIPEKARFWFDLNPFALVTEFYQEVLIEGVFPPIGQFCYFSLIAFLALAIGVYIHQKNREQFAEAL
jgi:ABC-type polysaccharide/polyol phosphate export permease